MGEWKGQVPYKFHPPWEDVYKRQELELPEGSTLERTRIVTDRAVQYLEQNPCRRG